MQFMITVNQTEGTWEHLDAKAQEEHMTKLKVFMEDLWLEQRTKLVFFELPEDRVHVRQDAEGKQTVVDGPAITGPVQVSGYYLVDVADRDEAIAWAKRGRFITGSNEVRAIVEPFG